MCVYNSWALVQKLILIVFLFQFWILVCWAWVGWWVVGIAQVLQQQQQTLQQQTPQVSPSSSRTAAAALAEGESAGTLLKTTSRLKCGNSLSCETQTHHKCPPSRSCTAAAAVAQWDFHRDVCCRFTSAESAAAGLQQIHHRCLSSSDSTAAAAAVVPLICSLLQN